jgi:type 2 lantibiotic biosynthesis protein LanM
MLLEAWSRLISQGREALFSRRLAWDGLDPDALAAALETPALTTDRLPGWITILQDAYGWGRDRPGRGRDHGDQDALAVRLLLPEQPLPFQELLLPLVERARQEVALRACASSQGLTAPAHAALERALLQQLTRIAGQPLYLAFAAFRTAGEDAASSPACRESGPSNFRYQAFLTRMKTGGLLSFFQDYSVAARLCATATGNWVEFVIEFLDRLQADAPRFSEMFGGGLDGPVVSVEVGLSDAHAGGRGVVICRFGSGGRLVYKPRSVALEQVFAGLIGWINNAGASPPLRAVKALSLPTHGWVEWVAPGTCDQEADVQRFYRRCGMLLAMLHGVQASDVHSGNLLASGEHPVLIDAETLLTHKFELEADSVTVPLVARLYDMSRHQSVLGIHMLPWFKFQDDGGSIDLGGLSMTTPGQEDFTAVGWVDVNADGMRLGPTRVASPKPRNLPLRDENPVVAAGYLEEVVEGFRHVYQLLLLGRGELLAPGGLLDRLGAEEVRFVFRHTNLYASLIERTLHPRFLKDGATRSIEIDVLARPLVQSAARPRVWPLLAVERASIEQLDVPLFSTPADSRDLALPSGEILPDCFESTAAEEARGKLLKLSARDERQQEDLIRSAFAASLASGLVARLPPAAARMVDLPEPSTVIARARIEAERLAQEIAGRACPGAEAPSWLAPSYVVVARRHQAGVGRPVLLDGSAGIALALAAVSTISDSPDLAVLAAASFEPLAGLVDDVGPRLARGTWDAGLGTGLASCIYGLLRGAELLGHPHLLDAAEALAALLDPAGLPPKAANDLVSGRAGAMLVLVRLYAATGRAGHLDRALRFADDLLTRRTTDTRFGLRVWPHASGLAEPGLAHGQSGIAYALYELAAAATRPDLRQAADEAIAHERGLLGVDLAGIEAAESSAAWSHGATGIGLVRAAMLRSFESAEVRRDLEAAIARTRAHLLTGVDDICSGVQGRIDLLFAAAEILDQPELRTQAVDASNRLLARASSGEGYRLGWFGGYQHPGLFQGLAGLAYSWARLVDPARVRSVALWA